MPVAKLPSLYCPFPQAISPYVEDAERHTAEWVRRFKLLPDPTAFRRFCMAQFGTLAAATHPYASRAALEMQAEHLKLQTEMQAQGLELPPIGIGISSGEAIAGEFGPPTRAEFTAMGRIVNLGARLCSAAKAGQVIISQASYELIQDKAKVDALEPISPKGISQPVQIYHLLDVAWE